MFQSPDVVADGKLINEDVINERLFEREKLLQSTGYAKQKPRLQADLEQFLASSIPSKIFIDASPEDIKKFLVFKDAHGKTQVHALGCTHLGKKGHFECGCPIRASAGSVDSLI